MFRVTREIEFCYGHRLLNYDGKCRHLHGHNGRAVITLEGEKLDSRGMLVDFGDIKKTVQQWIDENLDHNMLLCRDDPILPVLKEHDERVFVMDCNPTAENIAHLIYEHTRAAGLPVVEVVLWETEHCFSTYTAPARTARYRRDSRQFAKFTSRAAASSADEFTPADVSCQRNRHGVGTPGGRL